MADVKKEFVVYVSYRIESLNIIVDKNVHIWITCDESDNPKNCEDLRDVMAQRSSFTLEDVLRDEIVKKDTNVMSVDDIYIERLLACKPAHEEHKMSQTSIKVQIIFDVDQSKKRCSVKTTADLTDVEMGNVTKLIELDADIYHLIDQCIANDMHAETGSHPAGEIIIPHYKIVDWWFD